jgi:hypothetical protein
MRKAGCMKKRILLILIAVMMVIAASCENDDPSGTSSDPPYSSDDQSMIESEETKDTEESGYSDHRDDLDDDLCADNEKLVFGFRIKESDKRIALCISEDDDYIVYRYGVKDEIEVEFPEDLTDSWNGFEYSYYFRGGGADNSAVDLNNVYFIYKNYKYDLYEEYSSEDDKTYVGIRIMNIDTQEEIYYEGDADSVTGTLVELRWNDKIKQINN